MLLGMNCGENKVCYKLCGIDLKIIKDVNERLCINFK